MKSLKHTLPVILFLFLCACSYLPEEGAQVDYNTIKEETGDYILIHSQDKLPDKAFLFIPGGLVDPHVYLCWMEKLAIQFPEIAIIQIKVSSNLAISNMGKIKKVKDQFDEIKNWAIGGHSLGGVVSVFTVYDHPDLFDGLVLIASWATESKSLKDWKGKVLSVYASEDGLSTVAKIAENQSWLPAGMISYEIEGGNHSGFGCYGFQDGDMEASISQEVQQDQLIIAMTNFFEKLWD